MSPSPITSNPKDTPPIGVAPEGQDFSHPWIITAMVSLISFAIGFGSLWATGLWSQIWEWADAPFMIYLAILLPVIIGFSLYGLTLLIAAMLGKRTFKGRWW